MKKTTKTVKKTQYELKCTKCDFVIVGTSESQVLHNFKVHYMAHHEKRAKK